MRLRIDGVRHRKFRVGKRVRIGSNVTISNNVIVPDDADIKNGISL